MIYTVGHSTHTSAAFVRLLQAPNVTLIADVRAIPHSRRHPHFNQQALASLLGDHGIGYRHLPALGGRRRPNPESVNTAWQHPSFRGYADYMQTTPFWRGIDELEALAADRAIAVMCAEAVWWQCHRRLIADALLVRAVTVWHIVGPVPAAHALTEFARVEDANITYPGLL